MRKFNFKMLVLAVMVIICALLCVYNYRFGFIAVLISIAASILLVGWVALTFNYFAGLTVADNKLVRFTGKLKKALKNASTVYIMGHSYSDLDSVGASYGLYYALRGQYDVKMVVNKQNTMARPLIDFLRFSDKECEIFDYSEIKDTVDENSLLIVVDTHRPVIMDFKDLYERVDKVIIIDHHRKSKDCPDGMVAKYMKSAASSACEIVSLIIKLLGMGKISTVAATALMSGIMLDTKNFVMNTGPLTFKAAAFLRQNRADPVLIKKMFSESVEVCKQKYEIVSEVYLFGNFAVAKTEKEDKYTRIATAQAADELLGINGVMASFVMCPSDGKINISARSFGDVDVQKIMASLGGGGHKTVAACQIRAENFAAAEKRLITAINEYIENR